MRTASYIGSLLPDEHLSVTPSAVRKLDLRPNEPVYVVLVALPRDENDELAARAEVWRQLDTLRERLSASEGNLTEALLQAREEEDSAP